MSNNLHVCVLDKFIPPFLDFIRKEFPCQENSFYIVGDRTTHPYQSDDGTTHHKYGRLGYLYLLFKMYKADKIILHGLFDFYVIFILSLNPWLLKKCYWIIWGGDLYTYKLDERTRDWKIREIFRKFVIKRFGHLVTYIKGDVDLARKWYGATGVYHENLMYPSNLYKANTETSKQQTTRNNPINILVGNSADPSNQHIGVLEKLLPFKDSNINIYVPLSYGSEDYTYIQHVITTGKEWFGGKFRPLTHFMRTDEYLKFLIDIDIAIFNHNRQQAMGNTITLLGFGKTVYMRDDVVQWSFLKDKGIILFNTMEFSLALLEKQQVTQNIHIIETYFSEKILLRQLRELFL